MDAKRIIRWLIPVVARGIAWVLAAKLGWEATRAQSEAETAANALGALALLALSIYTSIKGRQKLLLEKPPKKIFKKTQRRS